MNALVAVLPVCTKDAHLAVKWLRWARALSEQPNAWTYELVVFAAKSMEEATLEPIREAIAGWPLVKLEINPEFYERPELGYAAMANQMFRSALEMMESKYPGQPMQWCETDAIPTNPDWMLEIFEEYVACGKPFMGDFHSNDCAIPHMTGNAVYPPDWRALAPSIAALPGPNAHQGWDTSCAHETVPQSHHSFRIQQVWLSPMPAITAANVSMVHPETSLFHRCKDGTLIDVLAKRFGIPPIPLVVPAPIVKPPPKPRVIVGSPAHGIIPRTNGQLKVEIMITSCKRDVEFTGYLLKSIEKYAKGFSGVTLVVPTADAQYFRAGPAVKVKQFDEETGKGFLHHMIQICRADEWCPEADVIVHVDPDCIFWQNATPQDFVPNGKCLLVREHYDIVGPRQANRLKWRECVEAATGIVPTHDTMVRHPNVYPRALYPHLRDVVEAHTGRAFNDYVFAGQNNFPHNFCEFVTAGTIGLRDFPDAFKIVDYDYEKDCEECGVTTRRHQHIYRAGRDKIVEGYSYVPKNYRNDWNKILRGITPAFYVK